MSSPPFLMREDDRAGRDPNLGAEASITVSANVKQRESVAAGHTERPLRYVALPTVARAGALRRIPRGSMR